MISQQHFLALAGLEAGLPRKATPNLRQRTFAHRERIVGTDFQHGRWPASHGERNYRGLVHSFRTNEL